MLADDVKTYLSLLLVHCKVEFIFISIRSLLPQPSNPIFLGMIVPRSLNIVLMFLKDSQPGSMGKLTTLLVVSSMQ